MNNTQLITLEKLRLLTEAGAVNHAEIHGVPGGWTVQVRVGMGHRILRPHKKVDSARIFATVDSALRTLREGGVRRVEIDQVGYSPVGLT